jgi:hypothetical protein
MPTTNFVLHGITGKTESHHYHESLKSIDRVTKDAYEPNLPLSVVVHIDCQKAPSVIQRFGDVKKLIRQTLDPMALKPASLPSASNRPRSTEPVRETPRAVAPSASWSSIPRCESYPTKHYAITYGTTSPCTSVRRKSRPL